MSTRFLGFLSKLALPGGVMLALCITLSLAAPVEALAQSTTATQTAQDTIDVDAQADADDQAIKDRIFNIYSVLDGLENVQVDVSAGVVTLSGTLIDDTAIDRAVSIASRIEGVVTVENTIVRDLSVDENLEPILGKVLSDIKNFTSALPLLAVALIVAAGITVVGYIIAGLTPLWQWIAPNVFLAELIATSIRIVFIALGLFTALDIINAAALLGAILGGAGVIGLAIGFAVRDTVDNYISSIMLSIRQPFRANDFVQIGERQGRVVRLTSRATILMTLDGNHLRIPNAIVFKSEILNFSRNPERRFTFELGVDADDDPAAAIETGLGTINDLEFILDVPEATAAIKEVGDSNILLTFNGWINQRETDFLKARGAAIRNTKLALEQAGFALPEPIYRLRFDASPFPEAASIASTRGTETVKSRPKITTTLTGNADLDVAPDTHVAELVNEERALKSDDDLLDDSQKQE